MRRVYLCLTILLCCSLASFGQTSPSDTLFTINDNAFTAESFLSLYQNNKLLDDNDQVPPVKEALDLYIDFHLKLSEAKGLQLDTLAEVRKEMDIYRDLAFNSYMYPTTITEEKILEAFDRIQYYLKARHILVKIKRRGTPKDTLEAYNRANSIYKELKSGKRFTKLAKSHSDDLTVKNNDGVIGYFTAFDMDYSFETAAYNLQKGEFSKPVRTQFGYHVIEILEKISNPGEVKIRHLLLEFPNQANRNQIQRIKQKADSIHALLEDGANFEDLVQKYSDDKRSIPDGGVLPWFGLFETHPKIEKEVFLLKINEISKPIKTDYGYHILQLLDKKDYTSLDKCRYKLKSKLVQDNRSKPSTSELIAQIKKEYKFTENKDLLSNFYSILDYAYADLWEPLFTIGDTKYTQEDFANYLSQQPSKDIYENFKEYINRLYISFSNNSILAFYKNQLEANNTGLKKLLNDYENGILVYYITKLKVWEPSVNNRKEVQQFFEQHIEDYGENVDFDLIKKQVLVDYWAFVEMNWIKELREKYAVTINKSTFNKIANKQND